MGARWFEAYDSHVDVDIAFQSCVVQARLDHGHAGTIAEKRNYRVIRREPVSPTSARELAHALDDDPRIRDKWGPAGAVPVTGGQRHLIRAVGGTPGGYASLEEAAADAVTLDKGETITSVAGMYDTDRHGRVVRGELIITTEGAAAHTGWLFFGYASS